MSWIVCNLKGWAWGGTGPVLPLCLVVSVVKEREISVETLKKIANAAWSVFKLAERAVMFAVNKLWDLTVPKKVDAWIDNAVRRYC